MNAVRRALCAGLLLAACSSNSPPYGARAPAFGMPEALPPLQAHEALLVDRVRSLLVAKGAQSPVLDARLTRAAVALDHRRIDNRTREACDVSPSVVEGALDWAGVYERPVCQRCYWSRKNPPPTPDEIVQSFAECLSGPGQIAIGIASIVDDERAFVSVVGSRRGLTLDPAPRVIPRGSEARLTGSADPGALPATVILTRPEVPSIAMPLQTDGAGHFVIPLGVVPSNVLTTVVNAQGELLRVRVTAVQKDPPGAFEILKDEDPSLAARGKALRARFQAMRAQRSLAPFDELAALTAVAQDEANDAQLLNKWVTDPMTDARLSVVTAAVPSLRITKWLGESVDDLVQQIERDGVVMFALTRTVTTKVGIGLASPPDGTGAKRLTLVLVAGVDDPGAWDGSR